MCASCWRWAVCPDFNICENLGFRAYQMSHGIPHPSFSTLRRTFDGLQTKLIIGPRAEWVEDAMKPYTITLAGLPISFIPKVNVGADGWSSDSLHHFISILCSTGRLEVGSSRVGGIVQELLPCGEIARLPHVQQRPQPSLAEAKKVADHLVRPAQTRRRRAVARSAVPDAEAVLHHDTQSSPLQ